VVAVLHSDRRRDRRVGLVIAAGLGHLLSVAAVSRWLGLSLLSSPDGAAGGGFLLWVLAGAVLVGAVPAALFAERGLVTPASVVVAAFAWTAHGSWQLLLGPPPRPTPVGPTPFGWYAIAWFLVLSAALAAGGLESGVRRVRARRRADAG
jgi:hypothetical protein